MIPWWLVPVVLIFAAMMITYWIAVTREAYSDLMAAAFIIVATPVLAAIYLFFYLLSFLKLS